MKEGFRQSMAWLHRWVGLLAGWILFFVFLTGTFGYVNAEVDHWMRPEEPMVATLPSVSVLLPLAEARLRARADNAESWSILFPGGRQGNALQIGWVTKPEDGAARGAFHSETLDFTTGQPVAYVPRETGGGYTLYWMHFFLQYVPRDVGVRIVGVCSMMLLVALLSGVVTHRKIFRDFFTFRAGKGQRSWLDGHNLLAVTALPFHVMITWSGLIFYLFAYMPAGFDSLYPEGDGRAALAEYSYGIDRPPRADGFADEKEAKPATLRPLAPMLADAEEQWGKHSAARITIDHPGRSDARVTIIARPAETIGRRDAPEVAFDGTTGKAVPMEISVRSAPDRFHSVMLGLHEAHFAGPLLRLLFVFSGLAGTAMIATGLILWAEKRKARQQEGERHVGTIVVDIMNRGTIIGLPIGIAAYFWANRLLPINMEMRGDWEMHLLFLAWGCAFLIALWRPLARSWSELCWIAAAAWGLIPALNILTTDRHLGVSIPAGDRVLAGFDLSTFAVALLFAWLARKTKNAAVRST